MSIFSFTNPVNGQKFEIEGPPAMTEAQARRVFEDQLNAGALVGLKPGDLIDSASQALDGVKGAAGQLAQQVQNIAGSATGALTGALQSASSGAASIGQGLTQFAGALPSAINQATSVAGKALSGITSSVSNLVPTNPINIGDLTKQVSALVPIQGLSSLDVRAAMSQATNLVGQASTALSNIGVGKFGLDASQLEFSGILKPGMASLVGVTNQVTGAVNSLTSVLSSPAAFTGKLGINSVDDLLGSVAKQDFLQQDLMNKGLSAVQELGIPIDKLDPGALAGTALNAAKSITDTFNWATGADIGSALKSQLDQVARAADFATNFAGQAINDAVAQIAEPGEAIETTARQTLDAAISRITGDAKIPPVSFNTSLPDTGQDIVDDFLETYLHTANYLSNEYRVFARQTQQYIQNKNVIELDQLLKSLTALSGDFAAAESTYEGLLKKAKALDSKNENNMAEQNFTQRYNDFQPLVESKIQAIDTLITQIKRELAVLATTLV